MQKRSPARLSFTPDFECKDGNDVVMTSHWLFGRPLTQLKTERTFARGYLVGASKT